MNILTASIGFRSTAKITVENHYSAEKRGIQTQIDESRASDIAREIDRQAKFYNCPIVTVTSNGWGVAIIEYLNNYKTGNYTLISRAVKKGDRDYEYVKGI